MAANVPIKVLIVDATEIRCIGIQSFLENEKDIDVVASCHTLSEAVLAASQLNPGVILLSVSLPNTDTFEACQKIAAVVPRTRIIALGSSPLQPEEIADSMMAGATGFLPIDSGVSDFVRVIRSSGRGEVLFTSAVAEIALRIPKLWIRRVDLSSLTQRERQMIVFISRGLNNGQIAAKLQISVPTVRKHVSQTLHKLGAVRRSELAAFSYPLAILGNDNVGMV